FEAVGPGVAVHDVRVDPLAVLVADAEPHRDARGHVVVDDVGALDELQRDLDAARVLEIERDAALTALATEERTAHHAHAVASHRLDLDDVGAEVADHHRAERAGEVLTEVDEAHSLERVHHFTFPSCASATRPENEAISASE